MILESLQFDLKLPNHRKWHCTSTLEREACLCLQLQHARESTEVPRTRMETFESIFHMDLGIRIHTCKLGNKGYLGTSDTRNSPSQGHQTPYP